jgi:thiamine transport system permease protein
MVQGKRQIVRRILTYLLYSIPLLFLLLFFFYPLASILHTSFFVDGKLDVSGIGEMVRAPYFWRLLWFTTWQALASTLLTLILGLPLAYAFSHYEFRGKSVLRALTTIPFVMPTVVVAAAFTTLLGNNGVLNRTLQSLFNLDGPPIQILQTVWIIIIAHAFFNVAVVVRTVGGFWSNLNPSLSEAATVLGANPRRLWREVTLPLLTPSIIAAALLVFLFCFTSFGVVLILGGLRFATLEVEVYRQAVSFFNLPLAAFLSLVQMAITFAVMAVYTRMQARASLPLEMRPVQGSTRRPKSLLERLLLFFSLAVILGLLMAPLLALAWRSFTLGEAGFTLRYYQELTINRRQSAFFVAPIIAVRNSLVFATMTMLLSLTLGIISSYMLAGPNRRVTAILDPVFLLPLGASAVTLGFGYIISMGSLRTSILLVPIAHTLIAMPFVIRTFLPALRSLDPRLRESASVMGAPPLQTWWEIDVPMLFRAVLVAAIFAFTISLGEFGASLLVSRPDVPTMPVVIYRAMGQPGLVNYGQALAMSTILMVVSAAAIILIERFRIGDIGEF